MPARARAKDPADRCRSRNSGVAESREICRPSYRPNLVAIRREGTKIYYRLAGTDVAALYTLVRAVANEHLPMSKLPAPPTSARTPSRSPGPSCCAAPSRAR